jgi:hypothetical protein
MSYRGQERPEACHFSGNPQTRRNLNACLHGTHFGIESPHPSPQYVLEEEVRWQREASRPYYG